MDILTNTRRYKVIKRIGVGLLIFMQTVVFCIPQDALAFIAQSSSYKVTSTVSGGGNSIAGSDNKIALNSIGEAAIGKSQSTSYVLQAGFVPLVQSTPPTLVSDIPDQTWMLNTSKDNAFDLDNYFLSPDGYTLLYNVSGNSTINVSIDPATHIVNLSQPQGFSGVEKVTFLATDTEYSSAGSNKVVLQVTNPSGPDQPVIYNVDISPSTIKEGDLVTLTVKAYDADNDDITFSYSDLFTETQRYKDGDFWYSVATWQTTSSSKGHYRITVTAKDSTNLTDAEEVLVNVGNLNHAPVLDPIPDVTFNENEWAIIVPHATDADGDTIYYYYEAPFDSQGKWFTDFEDAGTHYITVTASDGIDTVSGEAKVIINNVNRAPVATLTLSKYTLQPNETTSIVLSASEPDNDSMTFTISKDATQIASGSITSTIPYTTTTSFSSEGYYTITAKVKDALNAETTVTKQVHVTTAKAAQPVMGDFNGDGLMDLGMHDASTGKWEVCLSQAGVFESASQWLTDFGTSKDWGPTSGDFNGDGKVDIAIYNPDVGELRVALSNGSSFEPKGVWLTASFSSYVWQFLSSNFNGDKYTDVALYNRDTGEVRVFLGTGSGFSAYTVWGNFATSCVATSGDFNGDSLSDLLLFNRDTGEVKVAISNNSSFVDCSAWIPSFGTNKDIFCSDFNNDGLTDIGYYDKSNYNWYYAISTGNKFVDKGTWIASFGNSTTDNATTGDFNGDGVTDAALFDADGIGITRWTVRISTDKPTDLLTEIDNGTGGKTKVVYTYAAMGDNTELSFPVYVASSTSAINTVRQTDTYTQNYKFSGGYFDYTEREFRGFKVVKITDPITNNYSETYFYQGRPDQDGALKGQIDKIISYDGNGKQISQTLNTYEVTKAGPSENFLGFPHLTETTTTVCEETQTSVTTKNRFTYDDIGNLTEEVTEGDVSKAGDEKSTYTVYAQAYGAGFNRPTESGLKDNDGKVVTKKTCEYDTSGNLIKETSFIFNPLTQQIDNPITQHTYDSFGNSTSVIDAVGRIVTTEYENVFYAYCSKVTNSLGHSLQYVYDARFGKILSVTDANGQNSTTQYDTLGRILEVRDADNNIVTSYSYPDFNTKITTDALGFQMTEYADGLGRQYKTVSQGEDGTSRRDVVTEVFFNSRGLTEKESMAHYIDEDPANIAYVKYEYDIRGRLKKTSSDFPGAAKDAEASISYIDPLYIETIDALGHKTGTTKDVYGNIIEITEFTLENGVFHTKYEYDSQRNLLKTIDNQGNIVQIFYDSACRRIKMIDPDMGTCTYEYDLVGNLIRQTDAKGQDTVFGYDALNRPINRECNGEIRATYYYDDITQPGRIGRLYKIQDPSGELEIFYDNLGRQIKSIKTIDSVSYTVEKTYDLLGRVASLKYPDGEVVNYTYDANSGFLEKVQGNSVYVQDITYNAKGQIKTIKYGNNTQTNYTYGQDLRLSNILTTGPSSTTLQNLAYDFDKNGNLTTLTDNLRSNIRTYAYDSLDRLTQATNVPAPGGTYTTYDYQYDSIGNMTYKTENNTGTMTYGQNAGPHALTSAGGYTYQYDANGNMISGKNKTMEYDSENRLTKVNELDTVTTFTYDDSGSRIKKITPSLTTTYVGSIYEKNSDGKTRKYLFVGANKIATIESTGNIYYYHQDHLGSSNVITDQTGAQVQYCEYTPYGTLARNEGTDVARYKFTGKELDNTGLYYFGVRYYDPEMGRFITPDTIVQAPYNPQTLNRYTYCGNNPIKYVDPSGHWFWAVIIAIVKAVCAAATVIAEFVAANPVISGAIFGAVLNTACNASNIHNFGQFMAYAAIGAVSGAIGGGVGSWIGGAGSPFWGTVGGAFAGGFVNSAANAGYAGASFGQSMQSGLIGGGMAAGTAAVLYGAGKLFGNKAANEKALQNEQKKAVDLQGVSDEGQASGNIQGKIANAEKAASVNNIGPGGFHDKSGVFHMTIGPDETISMSTFAKHMNSLESSLITTKDVVKAANSFIKFFRLFVPEESASEMMGVYPRTGFSSGGLSIDGIVKGAGYISKDIGKVIGINHQAALNEYINALNVYESHYSNFGNFTE